MLLQYQQAKQVFICDIPALLAAENHFPDPWPESVITRTYNKQPIMIRRLRTVKNLLTQAGVQKSRVATDYARISISTMRAVQ